MDKSTVKEITILGGVNKLGEEENIEFTLRPGDIVSIVGKTGSGKSRLLGDIECLAQRDTITKRKILVNGEEVKEENRFSIENKLVAELSQNMNFVMDLSVEEFLNMHAESREIENATEVIERIIECSNGLAGEKFSKDMNITQLSGGQSRSLMIADTAILSKSPIVLIDEIENAGVDRKKALEILINNDKIVLMSTHDPILALMAEKRIVIKNGGIYKVIDTTVEEKEMLNELYEMDRKIVNLREKLRDGQVIDKF